MKPRKLTFFSDPRHGWLRVPKSLLKKVGVEDQITPYSYESKTYAYLEEDKDAGTFMKACDEKGIKLDIVEKVTNDDASCRRYDSYGFYEETEDFNKVLLRVLSK